MNCLKLKEELAALAPQTKNKIKNLICPFCKNDSSVIFIDFSKGRGGVENFAICQKKAIKSVFGTKTKGCDKRFKVFCADKG